MNDVLGQVVLSAGDPHLGAMQPVAWAQSFVIGPVVLDRTRQDVRKRRARLRLRQAHGAEEAARELRSRKTVDLRRTAVRKQQVGVGNGQERIAAGRDVGGQEVREGCFLDHGRQLQPALR